MPHKLCKVAGFALMGVGLIGFVSPHLLGMHLTTIHNVVHLLTGALALYFGSMGAGTLAAQSGPTSQDHASEWVA